MSQVIEVTGNTFQAEVLDSRLPVVVDFYATCCPTCQQLAPIIERLAEQFAGRIKFVKIDSDEAGPLAADWNVIALPTIMVFDDGRELGQFSGLPDEQELYDHLERWVSGAIMTDSGLAEPGTRIP